MTNNNKLKTNYFLEQLTALTKRKKKTAVRLTKNSKIIKTIIRAIRDKKAEKIISLDLRKIQEAVADFFIICEAGNPQQVRAIAENVEHELKLNCDESPYKHEGYQKLSWVLIDYVNVVVHVMHTEAREFYRLEEMWSDAISEEITD
jgi:ribosome-associated protein